MLFIVILKKTKKTPKPSEEDQKKVAFLDNLQRRNAMRA